MKNPALHQEARYEPASVIPLKQDLSLLDWLNNHNRLIPREVQEVEKTEEEEELTELMDTDNNDYDDIESNLDDED